MEYPARPRTGYSSALSLLGGTVGGVLNKEVTTMPSPSPQMFQTLVKRLGSEEAALQWLGHWSQQILDGKPAPKMPKPKK
jgi:hypothetical protein